jgi:hypothetical protein
MRDIKERKIGAFVRVREKEGDGSESGVSECILDLVCLEKRRRKRPYGAQGPCESTANGYTILVLVVNFLFFLGQ